MQGFFLFPPDFVRKMILFYDVSPLFGHVMWCNTSQITWLKTLMETLTSIMISISVVDDAINYCLGDRCIIRGTDPFVATLGSILCTYNLSID